MPSGLPEDEAQLMERLRIEGPLIIDGKEWFLDPDGHLHYRTIPDLTGQQLGLNLADPHPKGSLFAKQE